MSGRIIIIEDEAIIAAEIKSTLTLLGYEVVGHAGNGDRAMDLFASTAADLIILDINIRGTLTGIDLAHLIRDKYHVPFVFLTSYSDRLTLDRAKASMPYGYIVKPFSEDDLRVNVELALFKWSQEQAVNSFSKPSLEARLGLELSDREYELLAAFKDGLTYKQAASRLYISVNTVKTYQKKLFQLLGVASKYELLRKIE